MTHTVMCPRQTFFRLIQPAQRLLGWSATLHGSCGLPISTSNGKCTCRTRCSSSASAALASSAAHKLLAKQTIRIHNDFLDGDERYRLLVQLNRGWTDAQGGMLMLFASGCSTDVRRVLRPVHGSMFAFEISPASYHAVSTVHSGERYTLVYSFKDVCHERA